MRSSTIEKEFIKLTDTMDLALEERYKEYPYRKSGYKKLVELCDRFAQLIINEVNESFKLEKDKVDRIQTIIENPVFICGPMKSGTSLTIRLLDNHPELFSLPADSHYAGNFEKWNNLSFEEFFSYWTHRFVNPHGQPPYWYLEKDINVWISFATILKYFFNIFSSNRFLSAPAALLYITQRDINNIKYWVEKTPGNEFYADMLKKLHVNAKFINTVRHPLNNAVSIRKVNKYQNRNWSYLGILYYFKKSFRKTNDNKKSITDSYYIFRFEDLVSDTNKITIEIASFLNISYNDSLLRPTENGKDTISNSVDSNKRIKGQVIDLSKEQKYKKEFNKFEKFMGLAFLRREMNLYGYN